VRACEADPAGCQRMIASANRFASGFLTADAAALYTVGLLEGLRA
jgi:hypothetical protein